MGMCPNPDPVTPDEYAAALVDYAEWSGMDDDTLERLLFR